MGTRAGCPGRFAGSPGCLIFFVRVHASTARTPRRRPMYAASMRAEGPQCAFGFDRWGFCAARSTGVWNRPAQPPAPAAMDPAACVARRTRSRRTEAKAAAPKAAVARVSQSVEGPPSELRKPAVTQPDTNEEAAEDPRAAATTSAAAEPHTGGDARRASLDSAVVGLQPRRLRAGRVGGRAAVSQEIAERARGRNSRSSGWTPNVLKHFLSYLSRRDSRRAARCPTTGGASVRDDALWRPLVENFFPRGSHQLIRRLERQPRRGRPSTCDCTN